MNDDMMLSVLVITYNQENFISQTLDSILQQKHGYKYEIVIGEDCSTDGTKKIVEEYAAKYPDVIRPVYNSPNKGLIRNYFETLALCKGKYIMECAGDDWWLPGKVEKQIEFMETHPDVGMCYGKGAVFKNGKTIKKLFWGCKVQTLEDLMLKGMNIPMASSCFKKQIAEKYIAEENPVGKKWFSEDYPFAIWLLKNETVYFFDEPFFVYRVARTGISHIKNTERQVENAKKDFFMKKYFCEKYTIDSFVVESLCLQLVNAEFYIYVNGFDYKKAVAIVGQLKTSDMKTVLKKIICSNPITFFVFGIYMKMKKRIW